MTSDDDIREVAAIDFLYKTMVEREPGKRRIKPIESAIMEVYDMMEDSSDDPEYEASDYGGKHSDTCTDDSETASETETSKNRNEHIEIIAPIEGAPLIVIEDTDTGDDDDMDDARALQPSVQPPAQTLETQTLTTQTLATKTLDTKPLDTSVDSLPLATLKLICCVCVMTNNDADNEIVQCDGCNVTVHEGCYGISESHSIQSSDSLTSITPWFCDACKADITPFCELCPSLTGIFKETDAHRWVHLICALYTPNIGFHYPDKLSCISLYEIPMKKWGYKECCLCEEAMYRKTGITVKCDAGMCKRYFHVTCAQREGLLSQDASDEEIADPFYAHCKQHVDQRSKLQKITNYRKLCSNISVSRCILPKANILRKLELYREQYQANKHLSPYETPPPVEKHPRHLNTSSHAVRHLHRKAEFFKDDIKLESAYEAMKKRSQIKDITAVAFSADFVHYYKERESNFSHLLDDLEQLKEQNRILNDELKNTMRIYVDSLNGRNSSETKIIGIANQFLDLWNALKSATSKDIKTPDWMDKLTTPIVREERFLVHTCEQCSSVDKQYAMAQCDNCRLRYHIACLDPPLAKLPLKTKHIGWECNICTQAQSDEDHDKDIKESHGTPTESKISNLCCVCSKPVSEFNLKKCFECKLNYHVECIPDDLKPKNRRAKWLCFNCLQQITTPVIKKKDITTKARKSTPSKKYKNKMYFNPDSKRLRSHFTPDQIEGLNNAFDANIFLTGQSRKNVAATLHLSNTQVKIWFQNKRVGLRKQNGGSNTTDSSHGDQPDQGHYTGVKVIIPAILPPDPTSTICLDDEVIIQPRVVPPAEMLLTDLQIDLHTDLHIENPVDDDFFESKKRKRGGTGRRGFRTKGHKKRRGDDEEDDEEKNADDKSDNNDSNSENNVDNSSANSSANSSDNNGDNENVSDHDTETASDDNRDVVEDEPDGQDVNEADGGVEDDEKRGGEYEVDDDYEVDDAEDSDDLLSQSEND